MAAIMEGTKYDFKKATGDPIISAVIGAMYPSGPLTVVDIDGAQGPNPGFGEGNTVSVSREGLNFTTKIKQVVVYPNYYSLWLEGNFYTGPVVNGGTIQKLDVVTAEKVVDKIKKSSNTNIYIGIAVLVIVAGAFIWFKFKKGKK